MGKGCFQCTRILVIIFNFLFVLIGGLFVSALKYLIIKWPSIVEDIPDLAQYVSIIVYLLMCFCGLCGICSGAVATKCIFGIYLPIIVLSYASHLAFVATVLINAELVKDSIGETVHKQQVNYHRNSTNAVIVMDIVQKELHCCGSESLRDYRGRDQLPLIPWSCCDPQRDADGKCRARFRSLPSELAYDRGCRATTINWIWQYLLPALYCSFGISGLQLLCIALSLYMCCLHREPRRSYAAVPAAAVVVGANETAF